MIIAPHEFTNEELVGQIKGNPCLQSFIGLVGFQNSSPFDPLTIVYLRKRLPEFVGNDGNGRIVHHGPNVIRAAESVDGQALVNGCSFTIENDWQAPGGRRIE